MIKVKNVVLVLLFSATCAVAQETDSIFDPVTGKLVAVTQKGDNKDELKVWFYYPQGGLMETGIQRDSLRTGKWVRYDRAGNVQDVIHYTISDHVGGIVKSLKDGDFVSYFPNGNIREKGMFKDDAKNGQWETFFPNDSPREKGAFTNGQQSGKWSFYYRSGELREEGEIENNSKVGTWTQYHKNGKKWGEGAYKNGQQNGEWTWWHFNGSIDVKETYVDGQRSGAWYSYHDNGALKMEGTYENGRRNGEWKSYAKDGTLVGKGNFVNDKKEGDWSERELLNVSQQLYGPVMIGQYVQDKREGEWKSLDTNGKIAVIMTFNGGILNGSYREFYSNGQPKISYTYNMAKLNSVEGCWSVDGKSLECGTLKNGTGTLIMYDDKGNVLKNRTFANGVELLNE